MAEECAFYFYDCGYCCRLLKENDRKYELESDWVKKYCWGYNYEDCPHYKNRGNMSSGSSGCYLTSACVKAMGLSDDCQELTTLRNFRDTYIRALPNGNDFITEYYNIAPHIVKAIDSLKNSKEIWESVYAELVIPCVYLINEEKRAEAFEAYQKYTKKLQKEYLKQGEV